MISFNSFISFVLLSAHPLQGFVVTPPAFAAKHIGVLQDHVAMTEAPPVSNQEEEFTSITVPIKFAGPYPSIGLRFPDLATQNQKAQNISGISLDFVIDTAANTNTINAQVASELNLDVVGQALPGVGTSGALSGGDTFMLGDAQLEGTDPFDFMQNLTASALAVASPSGAGLLSLAFLHCFEGGVEFNWSSDSPSVTFHGQTNAEMEQTLSEMTRVPIDPVPVTQLPSIMLTINGVQVQALLDTGSPITVLNSQAAQAAGIETIQLPSLEESNNPLAAMANRFKAASATAKAASNGDLLMIAGANGQPTNLLKSTSAVETSVGESVSFGECNVYVGDIPGLAALNGIGVDSPPTAILGMDVLRKRSKMLLRARDQEVYF